MTQSKPVSNIAKLPPKTKKNKVISDNAFEVFDNLGSTQNIWKSISNDNPHNNIFD